MEWLSLLSIPLKSGTNINTFNEMEWNTNFILIFEKLQIKGKENNSKKNK